MVLTFPQLHQDILEPHLLCFTSSIDNINPLHQDLGIPVPLHLGEANEDFNFLLWEETFLHVSFQTSQEKGFEHTMESCYETVITNPSVGVEPLIEIVSFVENIREEVIEKSSEFMEIVLERSSGQQKTVGCLDLSDDNRQFTLLILDPVSLVNHHVLPVELLEDNLLPEDHLVRGDAHVRTAGHHDVSDEDIPGLLITNQTNSPHGWTPLLELIHPVCQGALGDQDHVGARDIPEGWKDRLDIFI